MNNIIKIIDEHEINRDAKIITYISLDGNDYAVYTISRDEENANIFASKVINSSFVILKSSIVYCGSSSISTYGIEKIS